jgi:hypothetical protein
MQFKLKPADYNHGDEEIQMFRFPDRVVTTPSLSFVQSKGDKILVKTGFSTFAISDQPSWRRRESCVKI